MFIFAAMILASGTYGKILLSTMKLMSKNINATDGRVRSISL